MTDEATQTNSAPAAAETEAKPKRKPAKKSKPNPKTKAKSKAKKRPKVKARRKKAANFTFKGPGGARERKARGEHLLIVRSRISTVKRIDTKLAKLAKKTGKFHSRNDWLANVIDVASKR